MANAILLLVYSVLVLVVLSDTCRIIDVRASGGVGGNALFSKHFGMSRVVSKGTHVRHSHGWCAH
jgi:hypothetical protein